jgi:hypothetical protein
MTPVSTPNAAHFYAAAADALSEQARSSRLSPENMTPAEQALVVRDNLQALALLRQGMRYPYLGDRTNWTLGTPAASVGTPCPNFVNQRLLWRLLLTEARVMAARGDSVGAINASLDALRFGMDIGHGATLIAGMIGQLCQKEASNEALIHVADLSAADARAAERRLESILASEQGFGDVVAAEKRFGMNTLQAIFADPHMTATSIGATDSLLSELGQDAALLRYGKQGIVDNYGAYMDDAIRRAALPYQQAKRISPARQAADPLSRLLTPDFSRARLTYTKSVARNRILLARLAVQAYCQEHGLAVPASLDDLTAGANPYLPMIPQDPFSATGQEPLLYADGNAYSVGENGSDEGGSADDDPATW